MSATLPVSVAPQHGESIDSWLEHLADANDLTTAQLLALTRQPGVSTRYLTLAPAPATISRLATLARVDERLVAGATLAAFDGTALDLTGLDPDDRHSYRQIAARGWTPIHGTQLCPPCLIETGCWQTAWRLLVATVCARHRCVLTATCPSCQRPFRDQRHSHLRRVGSATLCSNPIGQGPTKQCQHDLTTIPAASATPELLAMQRRVDAAIAGHDVTVLGHPASPPAYLADLRHLTTLLLHLGNQPEAASVAAWTHRLADEGARRSQSRGPRWGLRPPTDPALRGQALATADRILKALDIEAAIELLLPWIELTPATADGRLGWLADRTVMTPTLTRLVMAALAPHRRLSHHLDSQEARMDVDTRGVPQVIPATLYEQHLAGASSSSEATVRLFASLCLARMAPMITSWAKAAEALGLPPRMGINCARACSATMFVDNTEWSGRLKAVWEGLRDEWSPTGRWNYRNFEAKVARRRQLTRWFHEWADAVRPNTRDSSRGYALTFQWIHVACAHLDTSPAWDGQRPTAVQRAYYRQFEDSLDERQRFELSHALHKRA